MNFPFIYCKIIKAQKMSIVYGIELQSYHDAMDIVEKLSQHVNTNYSRSKNNITNSNFGNAMNFDVKTINGKRTLICVNKQYNPLVDKENMDAFINWCSSFLAGKFSIGPFRLLSLDPSFPVTNVEIVPGRLHIAPGYPFFGQPGTGMFIF